MEASRSRTGKATETPQFPAYRLFPASFSMQLTFSDMHFAIFLGTKSGKRPQVRMTYDSQDTTRNFSQNRILKSAYAGEISKWYVLMLKPIRI